MDSLTLTANHKGIIVFKNFDEGVIVSQCQTRMICNSVRLSSV
jgi:hypothetical protein